MAEIRKSQALAQLAKVWAAKRSEPRRLGFMQMMGLAGIDARPILTDGEDGLERRYGLLCIGCLPSSA
ncbi:hypothetical protein B5V03_11795 [Bradyrhizobium betae]|uniref:Uncharacterized protein n=1 Tax=Bradyrhizobium betae TaxID=244734 RepID=A0A4Q1VBL0_9BRAD|nr:hypothetical protein B5V03_11795 [Bradyrhizobium betae]